MDKKDDCCKVLFGFSQPFGQANVLWRLFLSHTQIISFKKEKEIVCGKEKIVVRGFATLAWAWLAWIKLPKERKTHIEKPCGANVESFPARIFGIRRIFLCVFLFGSLIRIRPRLMKTLNEKTIPCLLVQRFLLAWERICFHHVSSGKILVVETKFFQRGAGQSFLHF